MRNLNSIYDPIMDPIDDPIRNNPKRSKQCCCCNIPCELFFEFIKKGTRCRMIFALFLTIVKIIVQVLWPYFLGLTISTTEEMEGKYPDCEFITLFGDECGYFGAPYIFGIITGILVTLSQFEYLILIILAPAIEHISKRKLEEAIKKTTECDQEDHSHHANEGTDASKIYEAYRTRINGCFITFSAYSEIIISTLIVLSFFTDYFFLILFAAPIYAVIFLSKILFPFCVNSISNDAQDAYHEAIQEIDDLRRNDLTIKLLSKDLTTTRWMVLDNISKKLTKTSKMNIKANRNANLIYLFQEIILGCFFTLTLLTTISLVENGKTEVSLVGLFFNLDEKYTADDLTFIMSYYLSITIGIYYIFSINRESVSAGITIIRLADIENLETEVEKLRGNQAFPLSSDGYFIHFDEVSLTKTFINYNDNNENKSKSRKLLDKITFTAAPSTITGIVAASGAGKSTILKILYRFYSDYKGSIQISNEKYLPGIAKELRDIHLENLRKKIVFIPGDPKIFREKTLRDNLIIANPVATDELLTSVLKLVDLVDDQGIIFELKGYSHTYFSSGQIQRLGIAQGILKFRANNAKIVLIDEATSGLDKNLQNRMMEIFEMFKAKGATVLLIAHRLECLERVDQLIFLDKSKTNGAGYILAKTQTIPDNYNNINNINNKNDQNLSAYNLMIEQCDQFAKLTEVRSDQSHSDEYEFLDLMKEVFE